MAEEAGGRVARVSATAPGRVNLIGDHTDYSGGLAMPMAIDLATTVTGIRSHHPGRSDEHSEGRSTDPRRAGTVVMESAQLDGRVELALPVHDPSAVRPMWGRYVAAVADEIAASGGAASGVVASGVVASGGAASGVAASGGWRCGPGTRFVGRVESSVPVGSGLSSSAALEVAIALALGAGGSALEVALLCQRAETAASGVPCGVMDQLCATSGVVGHALLMDCATFELTPVAIPSAAAVWVVASGEARHLATTAYAERRAQCRTAERLVGPLPTASPSDIASIVDPVIRARARHVRSECARVSSFAAALRSDDLVSAGELMVDSHRSLRDDFAVSTRALDDLVDRLCSTPGVFGARLTGAGFGGCAVALTACDVVLDQGRRVGAGGGSTIVVIDDD